VAAPPPSSIRQALGYLITFRTHATWLEGDDRGSTLRTQNVPGTPTRRPHEGLRRAAERRLTATPVAFGAAERRLIHRTIEEVCSFRGWTALAIDVRTEHVHVVVSGVGPPEHMMVSLKAWSTRRLREAKLVPPDAPVWSRHGSTRYLWQQRALEAACAYVLYGQ
jgi:REP element-mobilizing transposase RayT